MKFVFLKRSMTVINNRFSCVFCFMNVIPLIKFTILDSEIG